MPGMFKKKQGDGGWSRVKKGEHRGAKCVREEWVKEVTWTRSCEAL